MADFFLDFREPNLRRATTSRVSTLFRFCDATRFFQAEGEAWSLLLATVDEPELWAPCSAGSGTEQVTVALAGRVALEASEWEEARALPGDGGLACRALLRRYQRDGIEALAASLNGNFAVFIADPRQDRVSVITDRCGLLIAYAHTDFARHPVLCSHPDVLAIVLGEEREYDRDSMTEFLMTGRVTFPSTYYRNIRGVKTGSIHSYRLMPGEPVREATRQYFEFEFKTSPAATEQELAEQLASAFQSAVKRRTLPIFGTTGVGMSGGLDSRAIVASAPVRDHLRAFTLFDEENAEYRVARRLADAAGLPMIPIQREFEHYAGSAEDGVRISGGTGAISSNHFLAVRARLAELGLRNLVTGCHCDYLLKGLALNSSESRFARTEHLGKFGMQFYRPVYALAGAHVEAVYERFRAAFPEQSKPTLSEADWLAVEQRRSFPLAYEADLAQRVIPQRVMPWFPLMVDNDILEAYLRIPSRMKLNASIFSRMLLRVGDGDLCRIPNINTGAPVGATGPVYVAQRCLSALKNRLASRVFPRLAARGSWPNWEFYIRRSAAIARHWERSRGVTREILSSLLGFDPYLRARESFGGREVELFIRIWTLKLWLEQRA